MRKAALKVIFDTDENRNGICRVTPRDASKVFLEGVEHQHVGLYEASIKPEKYSGPHSLLTSDDWHARMGHISQERMEKTLRMVNGVDIERVQKLSHYEPCKIAKSPRSP